MCPVSGIVFEKTYRAFGRTAGLSGDSVHDAFRRAILFLLSDEQFEQSLREAKPSESATWETSISKAG